MRPPSPSELTADSVSPATPDAEAGPAYPTASQQRLLWTALTALAGTSLLGVAAVVFTGFIAFLSWSYPILLPIGLAVIIALVLGPIVTFLQKRGVNRGTATLLVCLLAVIGFLLFWSFLLPPLIIEMGGFFKTLPDVLSKGAARLEAGLNGTPAGVPLELRLNSATPPSPAVTNQLSLAEPTPAPAQPIWTKPAPDSAVSGDDHSVLQAWLKNNLPAIQQEAQKNLVALAYSALGPVGQAFGFILGFGFVPIYVYYFLADQEQIASHWHELVPIRRSRLRDEVVSVLTEINTSLVGYFRGQIIVAACNGVLTFIGLWIIGIPFSLVLGIITGALSIVPFLGIIASIIPAVLLGFLSAKNDPTGQWLRPVLVLGVFATVQMTESMFITPRVQSHSTGLHPLAIILGILFWSLLLPGLLGPIVAVPLTCAVLVLLRRYAWTERKL